MTANGFAWCFDHGRMRSWGDSEPWCTSGSWVPFTAVSKEEAVKAKQEAYGDAQFLHHLSGEQQIEVLEIRETWHNTPSDQAPGVREDV